MTTLISIVNIGTAGILMFTFFYNLKQKKYWGNLIYSAIAITSSILIHYNQPSWGIILFPCNLIILSFMTVRTMINQKITNVIAVETVKAMTSLSQEEIEKIAGSKKNAAIVKAFKEGKFCPYYKYPNKEKQILAVIAILYQNGFQMELPEIVSMIKTSTQNSMKGTAIKKITRAKVPFTVTFDKNQQPNCKMAKQ